MPDYRVHRIRGVHQEVQQAARTLRAEMTPAERALWAGLRRLGAAARFRRQHPLGPFILDFCCPALCLVVELDGGGHDDPEQRSHDADRTARLEAYGYRVYRFQNDEVLGDRRNVLARIAEAVMTVQREGQHSNGDESLPTDRPEALELLQRPAG
ncbi:MAG TPA: endonuclease domain-containing protein [Chloroflexota bacterium]